MEVYTIGFTTKSAREFFNTIKTAGIKRLLDIRLNNKSQLAGFTKCQDLSLFLEHICGCRYEHDVDLAPTASILAAYRKDHCWVNYEIAFQQLLMARDKQLQIKYSAEYFKIPTVLLCSEPTPDHCHRRLVAEYLHNLYSDLHVVHL